MRKILILFILGVGLTQSCNNKNCNNAICTEEFAMLLVKLSSSSNPSLNKIRTESILVEGNVVLERDSTKNAFQGQYFGLATDSHLRQLGYNKENSMLFKVYQSDSLIYTGQYVVATDCCHINLKEGAINVVLP
jgi:hypothetical protein